MSAWLDAGVIAGSEVPSSAGAPLRLRASRCSSCERSEFPARSQCPVCGADSESSVLTGVARITTVTAVCHTPPGSLVEAPYAVAVAAFPEGISILGLVVGAALEDLTVGDEVSTVGIVLGDVVGWGFAPTGAR